MMQSIERCIKAFVKVLNASHNLIRYGLSFLPLLYFNRNAL